MNLLLLGPDRPELIHFLESAGDRVERLDTAVRTDIPEVRHADFLISFGYRHIIRKEVLDLFPRRAINLHISMLPWNRGADPNLWSFLEDTPKGVTIHCLDHGVDTGGIIVQKQVDSNTEDTLRTSYNRLIRTIEQLFREQWQDIRNGSFITVKQTSGGSMHRLKDKAAFEHLLNNSWDTPVALLIGKALVGRDSMRCSQ